MKNKSLDIFLNNETLSFSEVFASTLLIVYPAIVLLVPKLNGVIFGLLVLFGAGVLLKHRESSVQVNNNEKLFYFSLCVFFLVALFVTVLGGFVYKAIGKYLHLVLAIPIYIYLRHIGVRLFSVWYGLVAGSFVAAGVAIYDVVISGESRAQGFNHHIVFGDLALVMGCLSIAGLGWFKSRTKWHVLLSILALSCGVLASVLSTARGGWVAVPFLVVVFFWYIRALFSFKWKLAMASIIVIAIGVIYAVPQTNVKFHTDRAMTSFQQYGDSDIKSYKRGTSVGTRMEMWQASWTMFLESPLIGVGWGHYQEHARQQVKQGLRNNSAAAFDHPHSEYFSALAHGGILGLAALLFLFLTPVWIFIKYIKYGKSVESQRLALAGLVLVVAYMAFGISEPLLYRSRSVGFFAFYLAVFMAGIYGEENKVVESST